MTDFETLVRSMMSNGATAEDIAKMTTDTLNTINSEKKKVDSRKETLDKFEEQFRTACKKKTIGICEIAALCVLVCANSYTNWGPREMEEFYNSMQNNIRTSASIIGKAPSQALKEILNDFSDAITDGLKEVKTSYTNKRENKANSCGKSATPTGNTKSRIKRTTYKTPEEILIEFIDTL